MNDNDDGTDGCSMYSMCTHPYLYCCIEKKKEQKFLCYLLLSFIYSSYYHDDHYEKKEADFLFLPRFYMTILNIIISCV